VKPGGHVILGLYNRYARLPLLLRRLVARATGYRWIPFDPVLRDRKAESARREAWLRDQYQHPEEHTHSLAEVRRWFRDYGIDFVSTYPSTLIGHEPEDLLAPAEDEWWPFEIAARADRWMRSLGGEGGLFVIVGRRRVDPEPEASRPAQGGARCMMSRITFLPLLMLALGNAAERRRSLAPTTVRASFASRFAVHRCADGSSKYSTHGGPSVPKTDVNNPDPNLRSRPILGLQTLSGFTRDGAVWSGGRAYDPKSGRSYRATLQLNPDGSLKLTGCVLFICQSRRWTRSG
jgi:hypothetical protein